MTEPKERLPSKEGLREARKQLKDRYRKPPSDELVKIISQIGDDKIPDKSLVYIPRPKFSVADNIVAVVDLKRFPVTLWHQWE